MLWISFMDGPSGKCKGVRACSCKYFPYIMKVKSSYNIVFEMECERMERASDKTAFLVTR